MPEVFYPESALNFQNINPSFTRIYGAVCACSANKCARILSITGHFLRFRVNAVYFTGHFVNVACVFMHIPGACCIF
jgi:hypothetical protein